MAKVIHRAKNAKLWFKPRIKVGEKGGEEGGDLIASFKVGEKVILTWCLPALTNLTRSPLKKIQLTIIDIQSIKLLNISKTTNSSHK